MRTKLLRITRRMCVAPLRSIIERVESEERDEPQFIVDPQQPELFQRRTSMTRLTRLLGQRERAELERRAA